MAESPTSASPPPRKKKKRSKSSIAKSKKRKEAPKGSWSEVSTIKAGGSHVKSRWKRQYTGPRVLSEDHLAGDGQGWMPTPHANIAEEVENRRIRESNMEDEDTAKERMTPEESSSSARRGRAHPERTDGAFRVVPGDPASRVLVHVPHASTVIPGWVREGILLSDEDLLRELADMTDARTDEIALSAADRCGVRPWLFINGLSRLVIDPERFPDPEDEVMAAPEIGMGAVYTRTSDLRAMRADDPARDATLLETFFRPYAVALADLVAERLEATSSVTIIDLHSFPQVELPYERLVHPGAPRPACCIGTDEHHTPDVLAEMVGTAFARLGECRVNEPFVGTYVPLRFYKSDRRVSSVMVELRRDSYQHSRADLDAVEVMLTSLISDIQSRD